MSSIFALPVSAALIRARKFSRVLRSPNPILTGSRTVGGGATYCAGCSRGRLGGCGRRRFGRELGSRRQLGFQTGRRRRARLAEAPLNQDSNENQARTGAGGDNQNECDVERSHVASSGKIILKNFFLRQE